ncbi:MAG: MoaD/ThiS family protein [Pseudomonadota bacterium]
MKIKLKLYASLDKYLPESSSNHCAPVEIPPGATAHEVLRRYNIAPEMAYLVLLNGVYLEPEKRDDSLFSEGDVLAVWPPVAGG